MKPVLSSHFSSSSHPMTSQLIYTLSSGTQWQASFINTLFKQPPIDKWNLLIHFSSGTKPTSQVAPKPTSQRAHNDKWTLLTHFSSGSQWQVNFTVPLLNCLTMTSKLYWSTSLMANNDKSILLIHFSSGSQWQVNFTDPLLKWLIMTS